MDLKLPPKSVFSAQEVCTLTQVKPYVLRFWETEFIQITPFVNEEGKKVYTHEDIQVIVQIKEKLFDQKQNIEEVKASLDRPERDLPALPETSFSLTQQELENLALAKESLKKVIHMSERYI